MLRLVPDVLRMCRGLATDPDVPRGVRVRMGLLVGYLLMPIDLVPDFVPVVGYADDAIVVVWALRSVVQGGGPGRPRPALVRDTRGAASRQAAGGHPGLTVTRPRCAPATR